MIAEDCGVEPSRFPYRLERLGTVMAPEPGNPAEAEGVLNPASGRSPTGPRFCCLDTTTVSTAT